MGSMRVKVHLDFIMAVLLTVIAPLVLLLRSAVNRRWRHQMPSFLAYWRASSLLMVSVYLFLARRPYAMVSGISARIAIAWTLLRFPYADDRVTRFWVWVTVGYCLAGASINILTIGDPLLIHEYANATQVYARMFHRQQHQRYFAWVGDIGLFAWIFGAFLALRRR